MICISLLRHKVTVIFKHCCCNDNTSNAYVTVERLSFAHIWKSFWEKSGNEVKDSGHKIPHDVGGGVLPKHVVFWKRKGVSRHRCHPPQQPQHYDTQPIAHQHRRLCILCCWFMNLLRSVKHVLRTWSCISDIFWSDPEHINNPCTNLDMQALQEHSPWPHKLFAWPLMHQKPYCPAQCALPSHLDCTERRRLHSYPSNHPQGLRRVREKQRCSKGLA